MKFIEIHDCNSITPGSMRVLAEDFDISIWHGHELLKKMLTAKIIDNILVREIYESLELNDDLTHTWREAKHISFKKIFGPKQ